MTDCIFCKIAQDKIPSIRVYEDETLFVMMDIFPESKGHMLIVPRHHAENVFDMEDETLSHIIKTSKKIATKAKSALNADGIKIAQFNGAAAGQTVFHYHMHIVPAYENVPFKRHAGEPADMAELQAIANQIKSAVE